MALAVERVNFILLVVVETLVREVLLGASKNATADFASLPFFKVVDEVVVGEAVVVEQVDEDLLGVQERAGDEWVWERLVAHRVVVYAADLVDVQFFLCDFILCACHFRKCPHFEVAVIIVADCVALAIWSLLHLLQLDVLALVASNLLLKGDLVAL